MPYPVAGCPILAGYARVGIFRPEFPNPFNSPSLQESKPPPFEGRKGWGTRDPAMASDEDDIREVQRRGERRGKRPINVAEKKRRAELLKK